MKRGAAAGAVVWATPMVLSTPAMAATAQCSGSKPCVDYRMVNISPNGSCAGADGSCDYTSIKDCDGKSVSFSSGCTDPNRPTAVFSGSGPNQVVITVPGGTIPLLFNGKLGSNCYQWIINQAGQLQLVSQAPPACNQVNATLIGNANQGYTFTITVGNTSNCGGAGGHGISHVTVAYCR